MDNADIARVLDEIADLLEILAENAFRVRAYRTAARTVETLAEPAAKILARGGPKALCELPGIAKDLAGKIDEITRTGDLELRRELASKVPPSLATMMHVAGVGPKRAKLFYDELGIRGLDDLEAAATDGKLQGIRGVGEVLEKRILQGCADERARTGRFAVSDADAHAKPLLDWLRACEAATHVEVAGSLRRRRETIGDLDVLVASDDPRAVARRFLAYPELTKVLAHGETKCSAVLRSGMQVDMRVVAPESWGAALHYFTGSKAHNIAVRTLGLRRKLKINEYGVFRGKTRISGRTEEEVYRAIGLPWIPPELREDRGELDAAREGKLPRLVDVADVRGDLHVHADAMLREMVEACAARGYEYVAITDRGLDRAGFHRRRRAIEALRREAPRIAILHGAEVEILDDGTLDLDDATLEELDVAVAAVRSNLGMPEREMTARVLAALANPHVHVLAHPTGPSALDIAKVVASARDHGVLLEIDAQRLDLSDTLVRMARDAGARLVVDTDARRVSELDSMRHGIDQARRGWCTAHDVANTLPLAKLRALLRRRPARRAHARSA